MNESYYEMVPNKDCVQWSDISEIMEDILNWDGNWDLSWFELSWALLTANHYTYYSNLNEKTYVYLFIHTLTLIYTEFKVATNHQPTNFGFNVVKEELKKKKNIIDPFRVSLLANEINKELINSDDDKLYDKAFDEIILQQKKIINSLFVEHYKNLYKSNFDDEESCYELVEHFFQDIRKGIYLHLDDEYERLFYRLNFSEKEIEEMKYEEEGYIYARINEWFENDFTTIVW